MDHSSFSSCVSVNSQTEKPLFPGFGIHLVNVQLQYTFIVVSELLTHAPVGNDFLTEVQCLWTVKLCFYSYASHSFPEMLRSLPFPPSSFYCDCFVHLLYI